MLVKLPHPQRATAARVLQAFTDKLNSMAQPQRKTLTYDIDKGEGLSPATNGQ